MSTTFEIKHCPPNPTIEYARQLLATIPKGVTAIVSHGGGSTIDVGKWIARELHVKHTAIPTTAGTGSEVTPFCVLTIDGKKTTITDEKLIPTSYILNPAEIVTCPPLVALSAGLDAYCQALESWWSVNASMESRNYSDVAIRLIQENLPKVLNNRFDEKAQMNMLIAANMSGRAIALTRTNVCHAISYPLTDLYQIPHGIACAMTIQYFAQKLLGMDALHFLTGFDFPRYKFDPEKVADVAIHSPKLKEVPLTIYRDDIIKALHTFLLPHNG